MVNLKKYIFIVFIVFIVFFYANCSFSEIIFQENFDDKADWLPATQSSIGTLTTTPTGSFPRNWTFYTIDEMWPAPQYKSTIKISNENFRGDHGKGYTQWNESNNGNSGDGWGADGLLAKLFDRDYQSLYVRLYIKFMPGFRWGTADENMVKLVRLMHYDRTGNFFKYFTDGNSAPGFTFDLKTGTYGYRSVSAFRCDPQGSVYFCPVNETIDAAFPGKPSFTDQGQAGDGKWHCWEFYLKMNTKSGSTWLSNGEYRFWQDGQLIIESLNKKLIYDGDNAIGWNVIGIGGNSFNLWTSASNRGEQWYAIDDIIVSTEYIGPECSTVKKTTGAKMVNP